MRVLMRGARARVPADPSGSGPGSGSLGERLLTVTALLIVFARSMCAAGKDGPLKELYGLLGI